MLYCIGGGDVAGYIPRGAAEGKKSKKRTRQGVEVPGSGYCYVKECLSAGGCSCWHVTQRLPRLNIMQLQMLLLTDH
jgi:hypothetical protein